MSRRIETASINEVSTISEIIRRSFADVAVRFGLTSENAPTHPSNCQDDWIVESLEKGVRFYLISENGRSRGCVALEQANSSVCYLEKLAVLPEYRKKGFGKALVKHAATEAEKLGAERIEIGVIKKDIYLKNWYMNLDFQEKSSAQFDHLPFDVLFMFLELH